MKKTVIILTLLSTGAFSQDCSTIEDSLERLRCYDKERVGSEVEKVSEKKFFKERAIKTIRNSFKDPRAAIFEDMEIKESAKGELSLCGLVNAKNGFGGYTGLRPFFYNDKEWGIKDDELSGSFEFSFNFSKYCKGSLKNTVWELDGKGTDTTLKATNEDGFKFWLSCTANKRVVLNAVWDKDFKQERSFKSAFMPGKSTIIEIAPMGDRFYESRWELMKDGKTTSWKVQKRHYDFLGKVFGGMYFNMGSEDGHFVQINLDNDFRTKMAVFKLSCDAKKF